MNALPLVLTVFVACAVDAVEALTIVLAAGVTPEWKSTFQGMTAALVVLALVTAATRDPGDRHPVNRIKAFGVFWYDFVVGDDWRGITLVVTGLALTAVLVHAAGVSAWWLLPLFVVTTLAWSLHRATHESLSP